MADIETLNRYQLEALRTAAMSPDWDFRKLIFGLGITGEAGEVADLIKKEVGHGHEPNIDKMRDELGDVLWYLACLADTYGLSLSEIATRNIDKLKARYPEGFSTDRSVNRE